MTPNFVHHISSFVTWHAYRDQWLHQVLVSVQQFCHQIHIKRPMTAPISALCTAMLSPNTHKGANDSTNFWSVNWNLSLDTRIKRPTTVPTGALTILSPVTHKEANEYSYFSTVYWSFVTPYTHNTNMEGWWMHQFQSWLPRFNNNTLLLALEQASAHKGH